MTSDGNAWDSSPAASLTRFPAQLRADLRFGRAVKRQLRHDRTQWSLTLGTPASSWTLTKIGTDLVHDVQILTRARHRGPRRQLLLGVAATLRLRSPDTLDPGDVVIAARPGPIGAGDTLNVTPPRVPTQRILLVDWITDDDSEHRLALRAPRR